MGNLSTNFSAWEFSCPCGCENDQVSQELIDGLEKVRSSIVTYYMIVKGLDRGAADRLSGISIASGVRCPSHNLDIGGSPTSAHLPDRDGLGRAADPVAKDGEYNHALMVACLQNFERVGFGKSEILRGGKMIEVIKVHVDVAKDRPRPTIWGY